jgi:methionyl-tRNA formyltransferase
LKLVFMGTPDFAAASLRALLDFAGAEVIAVYCRRDRPAGRGQRLRPGPVKKLALEHGIPVFQPENFKTGAELPTLAGLGADLFAVSSYGLLLPQAVLDLPPLGVLNVHASLLPEYRGPAPIQRAVLNGDKRTGISIMRVELKLDSGPILLQRALGIGFEQNAGEVHDELAALGGRLLVEALERLQAGKLAAVPQDESRASYAPKIDKSETLLDAGKSAREVHNRVRAFNPRPGAQLILRAQTPAGDRAGPLLSILVQKGRPLEGEEDRKLAALAGTGSVLPLRSGLLPLACSDALYGIERLKPAGGRSMDAVSFVNGYLKGLSWKSA